MAGGERSVSKKNITLWIEYETYLKFRDNFAKDGKVVSECVGEMIADKVKDIELTVAEDRELKAFVKQQRANRMEHRKAQAAKLGKSYTPRTVTAKKGTSDDPS